MLVDSNGRPIVGNVKKQILEGHAAAEKRKTAEIAIAAGGVENNRGLDTELKSKLISRVTQRNSKTKKTPLVQKHGKYKDLPEFGKEYPGAHPLVALRAMAWSSTVVYSILSYRRHQLTKREIILKPKDDEPAFRLSILEYSPSEIMRHAAFDEIDKYAILELFNKIDPKNEHQRKLQKYEETKDALSKRDRQLIDYYNDKHLDFHKRRNKDKKNILKLLRDPDPYFSEESSWYYLLSSFLEDLLLIDRGALIKIRNSSGKIIALTPVDGVTIRPYIDENGFITHYVQVVDGEPTRDRIEKEDVILFRMNTTPDVYMYGYGIPNMDILWNTVLSDLYIDKGNIDYYRKGGSVPEGFLSVEPPGGDDDMYVQYDKEQLDGIQRQLQAIIMSDFTQVPLISGGKFNWIDLKGKRRDMQFKELAEYLTRKICAVFQVSPQDVGVLHDVNRSTAESQASLTKSKGLDTIAFNVSHNITRGVVDEMRDDNDLKLWFEEDDPDAIKDWWATVQGQLQTGYKSINEVKSENGEDPVPWGDTPMQGLKNWNYEEAMGQPAPGSAGASGVAPMPPGMDQVAEQGGGASPVPIPGQMAGAAPSLGQAPSIKSVLTELTEPSFAETYRTLNVEPILKNLFASTTNITDISDNLFNPEEPEVFESDLVSSAEYFLESAIQEIGVSSNPSVYGQYGNFTVHVRIPNHMYKKENFMKVAMYLLKFQDDSRIVNISPSRCLLTLHGVTVLPAIGKDSSYLQTATSFLRDLSLNDTINLEIMHEPFESYVVAVEDGDTVEKVLSRVEEASAILAILPNIGITEELADMLLAKFAKAHEDEHSSFGSDLASVRNIMYLGATEELTDRASELVAELYPQLGNYIQRVRRLLKKNKQPCTASHLHKYIDNFNPLYAERIQKIVNQYKDNTELEKVLRELFSRITFSHYYVGMAPCTNLELAISTMAYNKKIESIPLDDALECVEEFLRLPERVRETLQSYSGEYFVNQTSGELISFSLVFAFEQALESYIAKELGQEIAPDPAYETWSGIDETLRDELFELSSEFADYLRYLTENLFDCIERPLQEMILSSLNKTAMLAFMKANEAVALKQSIENLMSSNGIVIEFEPDALVGIETVDDAVDIAVPQIVETYYVEDELMVKSLVSKILKDENLDEFDKTMIRMLKR